MVGRPDTMHRGWILPLLSFGAALPRSVAGFLTDRLASFTQGIGPASLSQARWFLRFCTDFGRLRRGPAVIDRLVARTEGLERLDDAARAGRGIVLVSAHLGNWELGAAIAARRGIAVTVLSERAPDPALDRWREVTRARCGVKTAYPGGPAPMLRVLEVLRAGGCVAMLVDREVEPGEGAARIAAATGAALLPAFVPFLPDGRYAAIVEPAARDVAGLRAAVDRAVDRYWDQWYPPPALEGPR